MFEFRPQIVAALNEADGVKAYAKKPTSAQTGDAWVRWAGAERGEGVSFEISWNVLVLVPTSEDAREAWMTDHLDDLLDALRPVIYVYSIEFLSPSDSPVLQLTGRE